MNLTTTDKDILEAIESEVFITLSSLTADMAEKYNIRSGIVATHIMRACGLYVASCLKCMVGSKEAAELASELMNNALGAANDVVKLAKKYKEGKI